MRFFSDGSRGVFIARLFLYFSFFVCFGGIGGAFGKIVKSDCQGEDSFKQQLQRTEIVTSAKLISIGSLDNKRMLADGEFSILKVWKGNVNTDIIYVPIRPNPIQNGNALIEDEHAIDTRIGNDYLLLLGSLPHTEGHYQLQGCMALMPIREPYDTNRIVALVNKFFDNKN